MGSLISIITLVSQLLPALSEIVIKAIAASQTNDQATLDALHAQATAMADALM